MKDVVNFILSALPWIALALTFVVSGVKRQSISNDKNKSEKEKKAAYNHIISGIVIGMAVGAAIGVVLQKIFTSNGVAIGMTLGMLAGTIIGSMVKKQ